MATVADLALVGPLARETRAPVALRPVLPRLPLRALPVAFARGAATLADADLVVDLGDRIGSGRWWRGLATLGALVGGIATLGLDLPVLVASAPPPRAPVLVEEGRLGAIGPLSMGSATGRQAPPTTLTRRLAEPPERPRIELQAKVGAGGLEAALRRAGVGRSDLDALAGGLSGIVNLRGLKPGTTLDLVLGRRETKAVPRPLEALAFRAAFETRVAVKRRSDGALEVRAIPIRIDSTPLRVTGEVGSSLQRSLRAAGLPAGIVADYVRQMAHVVDFQRGGSSRDRFDVVIAHRRAETGETEMGQLLYAGLRRGKEQISLMRWGPKGEFFRSNGESARKGLIRTPVEGARQSSGFGMRFHPVLGYSRMHQGVDFAAPTGTPILASAAGTVVMAGWGGGYGNVVILDHGKGMRTRYAHMSKVGVRNGQRVAQGQLIGRVGSTGLSTGPHLHYEVWQNGRPVNPRAAKFMSRVELSSADYDRFRSEMARLKALPAAGG
jgi:murein DD-endopeptidase MepM/ murein hydrolase activator NlpD